MSVKSQALRALVLERLAVAADEIFALFERTLAQYEEEVLRSKFLQEPRELLYKGDIQTVTVGVDVVSEDIKEDPIKLQQEVHPPIRLQYPPATLTCKAGDAREETRREETRREETRREETRREEKRREETRREETRRGEQRRGASGEQCDGEEPGCSSALALDDGRRTFGYLDTDDSDEWGEEMTNSNGEEHVASLMSHSQTHHADYDDSFGRGGEQRREKLPRCSLCYKTFKNAETLEKHLEFHPGPFTCQICDKVFSSKSNYRTHLRCHADQREKPHKCPVCGRGFLQRGHVKEHMRIHTGEKPYTCTDCGRQFRQQNSLMRHVLSMHSEEKPYRCSICQKGFVQKPYFEAHMRKHTGERPFVCLVCGKRYKEKYCLKKHMSLHVDDGDITSPVLE